MVDVLTKEQRRKCMSNIRSKKYEAGDSCAEISIFPRYSFSC